MKIRKSLIAGVTAATVTACLAAPAQAETHTPTTCLLYTSDAADE